MDGQLKPATNSDTRQSEIERLAYALWQNAGEPSGTAERDWFLAEHAVQNGAVTPTGSPPAAGSGKP